MLVEAVIGNNNTKVLQEVNTKNPCLHCGKDDWCYHIGELSVCKRGNPPATGWKQTSKRDSEGNFYYAPINEQKPARPKQTRHWEYPTRDGSKLMRVVRDDNGYGKKKIWQERWEDGKWVRGIKPIDRANIPIYRYAEIRAAIEEPNQISPGEASMTSTACLLYSFLI